MIVSGSFSSKKKDRQKINHFTLFCAGVTIKDFKPASDSRLVGFFKYTDQNGITMSCRLFVAKYRFNDFAFGDPAINKGKSLKIFKTGTKGVFGMSVYVQDKTLRPNSQNLPEYIEIKRTFGKPNDIVSYITTVRGDAKIFPFVEIPPDPARILRKKTYPLPKTFEHTNIYRPYQGGRISPK